MNSLPRRVRRTQLYNGWSSERLRFSQRRSEGRDPTSTDRMRIRSHGIGPTTTPQPAIRRNTRKHVHAARSGTSDLAETCHFVGLRDLLSARRTSDVAGRNRECDQSPRTTVKLRRMKRAPSTPPPCKLAATRPRGSFEPLITIHEAQLQQVLNQSANAPDTIPSCVLAHEPAPIMRGLNHHSGAGIMKANWAERE